MRSTLNASCPLNGIPRWYDNKRCIRSRQQFASDVVVCGAHDTHDHESVNTVTDHRHATENGTVSRSKVQGAWILDDSLSLFLR